MLTIDDFVNPNPVKPGQHLNGVHRFKMLSLDLFTQPTYDITDINDTEQIQKCIDHLAKRLKLDVIDQEFLRIVAIATYGTDEVKKELKRSLPTAKQLKQEKRKFIKKKIATKK